jgi:hypothetical protein
MMVTSTRTENTNNITTRQVFRDEDLELTSQENTQVPESRMVAVEARTKSFIIDALAEYCVKDVPFFFLSL